MTLSIVQLRNFLETKPWAKNKELISHEISKAEALPLVTTALITASKLINKYPKKDAEDRRQGLFEELNKYFNEYDIRELIEAQETLILVESGYREMVIKLASCASSNLDGATKVHSVIALSIKEVENIKTLTQIAFEKNKQLGQKLDTDYGQKIDLEAVIEQCAHAVAVTLQMEAHKNNWVNENDVYVLPDRTFPSEEDLSCSLQVLNTAIVWNSWQSTEQRARFRGGKLLKEVENDFSRNVIITHIPSHKTELDLNLASERLNLGMMQTQLSLQAKLVERFGRESLKPGSSALRQHFSVHTIEEAIAIESLSDLLCIDVTKDETEYFGLKLKTIVRCYASLTDYVRKNNSPRYLKKTRSGWAHVFSGYGISAEQAQKFISSTTFRKSSSDLFDNPFIQLDNGQLILFSAVLHMPVISRLILSNLSSNQIDLHDKGKSFEHIARESFKESGIECFSLKKTIDNEEYEIDIVVPWDNYLFIIECKNNNLPFGVPSSTQYFQEKCEDNINQLNRLCNAIKKHPILLNDKIDDIDKRIIVPVLLNCLPYSQQGAQDGVYFYDYQSLSRFFLSGTIGMTDGLSEEVFSNYPQFKIWSADKPSSEDFMNQLRSPFSHNYLSDLFETVEYEYPFGNNWIIKDTELAFTGINKLVLLKEK